MLYAPSRIRPDFRQAVRKPAWEGSREKRAGESSGQGPSAHRHTCRTVHGSFLILTSPQSQPDRIFLSGPAGHNAAGSGNSRSAEASRFFSIFPRRDHRRRGSGSGIPSGTMPQTAPDARLPRDARPVFRHKASRGRTHSLPPRTCPTCLRKIPGSPGILSCSCRLTFFRRPDENSARQTGGLSAPARDARL